MDRRGFFKDILTRTVNAGVEVIDQRATAKAKHWFRPPFAKDELDFLLACTRCNACIEACPHEVIFPLPIRCGAEVVNTPALDVLNKGCHLCKDWACVTACEDKALIFPALSPEKPEHEAPHQPTAQECPPLGKAVVDETICIAYSGPECGACRGSCPIADTLLWQGEKPSINSDTCVGCGLCRQMCITTPKAIDISVL